MQSLQPSRSVAWVAATIPLPCLVTLVLVKRVGLNPSLVQIRGQSKNQRENPSIRKICLGTLPPPSPSPLERGAKQSTRDVLDAAGCYPLLLLTAALLMTSLHSKAVV